MNRENFRLTIEGMDIFFKNLNTLYGLGVDLYESPYELTSSFEQVTDNFFKMLYTESGREWINWFIYENDFGREGLEAFDEDKLICQNIEQLYDYLEKNHSLWTKK